MVWRGLNPTKAYDEISAKYPKSRVAIAWRTKEKKGVLTFLDREML